MVGIAVISHGGLCEGILDSVSMVAGTMDQTESVSLKPGVSPDTYKEELRETIQRLDTGDGVVVFVDLMGGTPLSFYDWYADLPPSSPQVWGEQTDTPESGDWYNAG